VKDYTQTSSNHNDIINLLGSASSRKVLFVDDRSVIQRSFKRTISRIETDTVVISDIQAALEALRKNDFAVVLAGDGKDYGTIGLNFLEEARHIAPDTIRIFISGKSDMDSTVKAINKIGLFSFIVMPWDPNELRDNVRRACDRYSLKLENQKLGELLHEKAGELKHLARNLERKVQDRTTSLLLGLNAALDLRDTETQVHSRRVALYARRIAQELDFSKEEILTIERGSLLHDIGKIGVSDTILLKPGKLTDEEWVEMRKHAEHGYRILEGIEFLGDARLIVWQHHERWDGKGYPNQLAGNEIIIGARIFGIIDTYDAITSDRPYRKGQTHEVAIKEIEKMSGTQFDADLVKTFLKIPKSEILNLRDAAIEKTAGMD